MLCHAEDTKATSCIGDFVGPAEQQQCTKICLKANYHKSLLTLKNSKCSIEFCQKSICKFYRRADRMCVGERERVIREREKNVCRERCEDFVINRTGASMFEKTLQKGGPICKTL